MCMCCTTNIAAVLVMLFVVAVLVAVLLLLAVSLLPVGAQSVYFWGGWVGQGEKRQGQGRCIQLLAARCQSVPLTNICRLILGLIKLSSLSLCCRIRVVWKRIDFEGYVECYMRGGGRLQYLHKNLDLFLALFRRHFVECALLLYIINIPESFCIIW